MYNVWVIGGCLIALTTFADVVPKYPFPESESTTYSLDESPITDWIFEHWAAGGYAVPEDGEHFVWRKYVIAVSDFSKIHLAGLPRDALSFVAMGDQFKQEAVPARGDS
jgi:hypothetical protein